MKKLEDLTQKFAVAFNDVDLCLKIRKAGYLIVYDPYAELIHYESSQEDMKIRKRENRTFPRRSKSCFRQGGKIS